MNSHSSNPQIVSVLRNLALSGLMLFALSGAVAAQTADQIQPSGPNAILKANDEANDKAANEMRNRYETDRKYQETIRSEPPAAKSNDPWGNVRPAAAPAAKPAAKTATKTASGSGKPVAIKPAPATNATPPKSQ
jgi:hypothetical protein